MKKKIVVTGANGDIGRQVVEQALSQGNTVIATIRNEKHISSFPDNPELKFAIMHTDDHESVASGFKEIMTILDNQPPDVIIHCAAIESPSTIEYLEPESLEYIFKVNTIGSLNIIRQSISILRGTGGKLILCSSLWGRVSAPIVGPYAATKWALEAIADSARRETRGMNFSIVLANIGAVKSRMLDSHIEEIMKKLTNNPAEEIELYGTLYKEHAKLIKQADKVAITSYKVGVKLLAIANIDKPKPRYIIGADAMLFCFLSWLLPRSLLDKILGNSALGYINYIKENNS